MDKIVDPGLRDDDPYDLIVELTRSYFKDDIDDGGGAWHFPPDEKWPNGLVTDSQMEAGREYVRRALLPRTDSGAGWKCKASSANMGANNPQDCSWPTCGCDPYANKVIEALDLLIAKYEKPADTSAPEDESITRSERHRGGDSSDGSSAPFVRDNTSTPPNAGERWKCSMCGEGLSAKNVHGSLEFWHWRVGTTCGPVQRVEGGK